MKWLKHNTLYVNGSSLTAGGGLGNQDIKKHYKDLYNLEWENEKDVTYPRYVADYFNLNLIHEARCGSGAPRLVRETYEYIFKIGLEKAKKTIFILEVTDPIHRVDMYCNEIDEYIIVNVRYDDENCGDSKLSSIQVQNVIKKDGTHINHDFFIGRIENEIKNYLEKYHNPIAYTEKYYGDVAGLLSFLEKNGITFFYMFNENTLKKPLEKFYKYFNDEYELRVEGHNCINQFSGINKLTIYDELNGKSSDLHPGYFGNKKFSEHIIKLLIEKLKPKIFAYGDSHTQPFIQLQQSGMEWANKYIDFLGEIPKNYVDIVSENFDNLEIINSGRGGFSNQSIYESFLETRQLIKPKDILFFGWTTESRFRIANETNQHIDIIPFNSHPKQNDDVSKTTTNEIGVNRISYNIWWRDVQYYIDVINDLFPKNIIYHWTWIDNHVIYPTRLWSEEMLGNQYIIVVSGAWQSYDIEYRKIIENNADILFDMNLSTKYHNIEKDVKDGKKVILKNFINTPEQKLFFEKYKFKSRILVPSNYKQTCFDNFIPYKKYTTILQETNGGVDDLHTSKCGHQELAHDLTELIIKDLLNNTKNDKNKKSLL